MNESEHNPYIIPLSILISGVMITGAIMYVGDSGFGRATAQLGEAAGNGAPTPSEGNNALDAVRPIDAEDHMLGNPSAPVKIIEYSDLECPYCARFHESMKQAMDEFGKDGKVAWIYRHFPLEQIHSHARLAANGAECANKLGGVQAFWNFTDTVFSRQSEGLSDALFSQVAEEIGLDRNAFTACSSSGAYDALIDVSTENAIASGGAGTPYSIIIAADGTKQSVNGAVPYAALKSQIEEALGK